MISEDQLEQLSLNWFQDTGWDYVNGVDISPDGDDPERDDYRVVVLKDRLAEAVARLNPDLPQSAVDDVVHILANPDHPSLEQNKFSRGGISVMIWKRRDAEFAEQGSSEIPLRSPRLRVSNCRTPNPGLIWKHRGTEFTEKVLNQNSVSFVPLCFNPDQ